MIFQFYNLYKTRGLGIVIFVFIFALIIIGALPGLFESLILDKLTPNYVIIGNELGKIPRELFTIKGNKFWPILFIIILQILSLLFYLEIFEFNFCSLNKNTKKNITKRGIMIIMDDDENNKEDNEIVIKGYCVSENPEGKELEMSEKKDDDKNELDD